MNWFAFALKLPTIIEGAVKVVDGIKDAKGSEKKAAVLAAIPASIDLTEFAIGRDAINNPAVAQLISAYIDAESAALKARNALKAGIMNASVKA